MEQCAEPGKSPRTRGEYTLRPTHAQHTADQWIMEGQGERGEPLHSGRRPNKKGKPELPSPTRARTRTNRRPGIQSDAGRRRALWPIWNAGRGRIADVKMGCLHTDVAEMT